MPTREERFFAQRAAMFNVLYFDFQQRHKNLKELQVLYDQAVLADNSLLFEQLSKTRSPGTTPSGAVFTDIMRVIYICSEKNPAILDSFAALYAKKYPDCIRWIRECERAYSEGVENLEYLYPNNKISKLPSDKWIMDKKYYEYSVFEEFSFKLFLLFGSEVIDDLLAFKVSYDVEIKFLMSSVDVNSSTNKEDEAFTVLVTPDEENIYETKQYKKWAAAQKQDLLVYLKDKMSAGGIPCNEKNISECLNAYFFKICGYYRDDGVVHKEPAPEGYSGMDLSTFEPWRISQVAKKILGMQTGVYFWYHCVNPGLQDEENYTYHAEFDVIKNLDLYLRSYVSAKARATYSKSKTCLTRREMAHMDPIDPVDILSNLSIQYQVFLVSELLRRTTMSYYKAFSFENFVNRDIVSRYKDIITELEETIEGQKNRIAAIETLNRELKNDVSGKISDAALEHQRTTTALLKESERKDKEIAELKAKIRSQEEFISLQARVADQEESTFDLAILKTKRYLFVGRVDEIAVPLRKEFPDSIFMDSETAKIDDIKVDAIVMLIQGMNHSMFYKVNSENQFNGLPRIYMNQRNINILYGKMQKGLS